MTDQTGGVGPAAPKVSSVTPANNATGVKRNANLTATFSEKMDPSTLTKSTFQLFKVNTDGSTTQVTNVTVTPNTDGLKATLNPFGTSTTLLAKSTKYKAVVTTEAKDVASSPLDQNPTTSGNQQMVCSFKTGLL
jgi:Bacterial Ig-like domain